MTSITETLPSLLRLARGLALVAGLAALVAPCGAAEDQTIVPSPGDYKAVDVVLENGDPQEWKGPLFVRGGIRDGKLTIPDSTSVRVKAGELVFTADAVKGEFGWRKQKQQNQGPADAVIHRYYPKHDGVDGGFWLTDRHHGSAAARGASCPAGDRWKSPDARGGSRAGR